MDGIHVTQKMKLQLSLFQHLTLRVLLFLPVGDADDIISAQQTKDGSMKANERLSVRGDEDFQELDSS